MQVHNQPRDKLSIHIGIHFKIPLCVFKVILSLVGDLHDERKG